MKELITAMNISEARKAGLRSISVPPGALITPQARDDAKSYGIALVTQEKPIPVSIRTDAPSVALERPSVPAGIELLGKELADSVKPVTLPMAAPQKSVQPVGELAGAAIVEAVLTRLNTLLASRGGIAAFPGLESTIAAIVAEYSGTQAAALVAPATAGSALPGVVPVTAGSGLAGVPGVDVVRLFEKKTDQQNVQRVQGEVEVEEALLPGQDGPGVTRLSWSDSSFAWTFEFDEVLTVTDGAVEVKSSASPMAGIVLNAGEALRVRAGTSLTLAARGNASCVCSSWPAGK